MPAAVAVPIAQAAIPAVAGVGGALIAQRGNNRALEIQDRAAREALQYQREQEWRARMDARTQYDNYMRATYGDRYQPAGPPAASPAVAPVTAPVATPAAPVVAPEAPVTLGSRPVVEAPPLVAPPEMRTLGDLGGWTASNYARYLGGRR